MNDQEWFRVEGAEGAGYASATRRSADEVQVEVRDGAGDAANGEEDFVDARCDDCDRL